MHERPDRSSLITPSTPAIALALVLLVLLGAGAATVVQTIRMVPGASVPSEVVTQSRQRGATASGATMRAKPLFSGPGWGLMTRDQKLALYPLAERWDYMSQAQKRRWLALADTFGTMPEEEQHRLHQRMGSWAGLTAQQRSQARLNFATARALSPADIEAQWEAYQALSSDQKMRLAATAPKPRGAATALNPVPSKRLAKVPAPTYAQSQFANAPKIVLPSTSAVRLPAPAAPVELAPAPAASAAPVLPTVEPHGNIKPDPADQDEVRPADPLPELYVN